MDLAFVNCVEDIRSFLGSSNDLFANEATWRFRQLVRISTLASMNQIPLWRLQEVLRHNVTTLNTLMASIAVRMHTRRDVSMDFAFWKVEVVLADWPVTGKTSRFCRILHFSNAAFVHVIALVCHEELAVVDGFIAMLARGSICSQMIIDAIGMQKGRLAHDDVLPRD